MNTQIRPPRIGPQPWEIVRTKLDQSLPFANMRDTPYYRDAVWEQFSKQEYDRRYRALRAKMREHKLDALIVPGGPSHWSFGGGMLWLTGHWEWHALASYVVVPLDGEPTLIYSMGGTHAEAVRRQVEVAVQDVRHSRNGRYADVMVERLRELKLERGRIGQMEIDPRHGDYLPVNQYNVLRDNLPEAELVFTQGLLHELLSIHSAEELDCVRQAGVLCQKAMEAMVARARPGVKEYELRAAAGAAILEGGGDIDFLIIGSTPMAKPAMIFGNPRPSGRVLQKGDIINMELAAGYRGYTAQIGSPICLGEPTEMAQLMGAVSADRPAIMLLAGPMMTGRHRGERLGACTDCRRFWARYRAGDIDAAEISAVEGQLAVTAGTCAVMGTASTMACLVEALGMCLPGTAAIPAVHADRLRAAEASGVAAVKLIGSKLTPSRLINEKSVENALRVLLALGGSTNAVIHLTAIAGRAGVKVSLERLNALSDATPVLVNLKPVGNGYMEDFCAAGGMGALLRELKPLLHLDCITVTGETLHARLDHEADQDASQNASYVDRTIIAPFDKPLEGEGGLVALFGNLAPKGAILKRSAADAKLFEHEGRAVVFASLDDLAARIDDPALEVEPADILVLQNAGPHAAACMPEAGYLPIPKKLAQRGVKDMIRISDARMSGTAFGAIVLHVTPDAASGGPLGLVRNGDRIRLSVKNRRIELLVDEAELKKRAAAAPAQTEIPARGYGKLFAEQILGADEGCDFKFLMPR